MFRYCEEDRWWSREATSSEIAEMAKRRNLEILEFMVEGYKYKWKYRLYNKIIDGGPSGGDLLQDTGYYIQWQEPWRDKVRSWLCRKFKFVR